MNVASLFARLAILPLPLLTVGAAPGATVIPHPEAEGEAVIVPSDSPVRFRGWDEYGFARFDGQFALTGTFTYRCGLGCPEKGPFKQSDLEIVVAPDPAMAARLPNWAVHRGDMALFITREAGLARAIGDRRQRAALLAGKAPYLKGQVTIVVDDFWIGIECDGPSYGARFVSVAKAPTLARPKFAGVAGCGG